MTDPPAQNSPADLLPLGKYPTAQTLMTMTPEVMVRPDARFYGLSVLFRDALESCDAMSRSVTELSRKMSEKSIPIPSRVEAVAGAVSAKTTMLKTAMLLIKAMGDLKVKELDPWIKEHGKGGALEQLMKAGTLAEVDAIMAKARGHLDTAKPK